jgi:hypothetical protein
MNRFQLENIYQANGLTTYRLKTTDDLLKVHGVNYKNVPGYDTLDDTNRQIYEKFIINIYNGFGLDLRATLYPLGIYYVEDIDYIAKEKPDNDYFTVLGGRINYIDKNGNKRLLHEWEDEEYKHLPKTLDKPEYYLRFEYEMDGREEWLHVIKEGKEWY